MRIHRTKAWTFAFLCSLICACPPFSVAQETEANSPDVSALMRRLLNTNSASPETLSELSRKDVFNNLAVPLLTRIFDSSRTNNALRTLISDLNLRPKVFQVMGSSNDATFGLEFAYSKSVANKVFNERSINPMAMSLAIAAKGDIALEADKNPNNLIESSISLHFFQGLGGIAPALEDSEAANKKIGERRLLDLQAEAEGNKEAKARLDKELQDFIRPQFFYDFDGNASYETDQQFDNRQWAYGCKVALAFRDWRPRSDVGWFNLLDYPFAAIRSLANGEPFQPSGRSFPLLAAGIDMVDPTENDARLAVDPDDSSYSRLRIDASFTTPVIRINSELLYVTASFRHFHEFGASSLIKSANMDQSTYFVVRLDLPYRFNVSYATGRLPLDVNNDEVFALGWRLNF